jgi:hypothetical protein
MGNAVDYNNLPSALETKILLSSIKKNNNTNTNTTTNNTTINNTNNSINDDITVVSSYKDKISINKTIKQKKYGRSHALDRIIQLQLLWEENEKKNGNSHNLSDLRIGMPSTYMDGNSQDNLPSLVLSKSPQDSLLHMSSVLKNLQNQATINTPKPPVFYVNEDDKEIVNENLSYTKSTKSIKSNKSTVDNDIDNALYSIIHPDSSRTLNSNAINTAEVITSSQVLKLKKLKEKRYKQMISKMNNNTDGDIDNLAAGGTLLEGDSISSYSIPESPDNDINNINSFCDDIDDSSLIGSENSFKLLPIDKSVFLEPITINKNNKKINDNNDIDDSSVGSSTTKKSNNPSKNKISCSKCLLIGELWCKKCQRAFCLTCWGLKAW